jgi:hypothetical protein
MKFTPGARLEIGYREKLPRESEAILKIPIKELQRGPILAYSVSVEYF